MLSPGSRQRPWQVARRRTVRCTARRADPPRDDRAIGSLPEHDAARPAFVRSAQILRIPGEALYSICANFALGSGLGTTARGRGPDQADRAGGFDMQVLVKAD